MYKSMFNIINCDLTHIEILIKENTKYLSDCYLF